MSKVALGEAPADLEVDGAPDLDNETDIQPAKVVEAAAPTQELKQTLPEGEAAAVDEPEVETVDELDRILAEAEKADRKALEMERDPATGQFKAKVEQAAADPQKPADDPFKGWDPEHRKVFEALPEPAKQLVQARSEVARSTTINEANEHFRPIVELAATAKPFMDVFQQPEVAQYLERISADLQQPAHKVVANILNFESKLRYGTMAEKHAAASAMLKDYGISLDPLAATLDPDAVDPRDQALHDMRQKVAALEHSQRQIDRQAQQALEMQSTTTIQEFASQKDGNGQPKYPFVATVRGAMADLIESGQAKTLEEAYAKAAAPITASINARAAEEAKRLRERNADGVRRARTIQPVRGSMGQRTAPALDLDSIIRAQTGA